MICFKCKSDKQLIVFYRYNDVKYYICMSCFSDIKYNQVDEEWKKIREMKDKLSQPNNLC